MTDAVRPLEVLLVEDNPGDVLLVRQTLGREPYPINVRVAVDGEQGLQMLESSHFKPDLVILDLNIPKVFGLSFLGRYRAEAPVVVFTVSTNPNDRQRSLELGARAYVEKPDDLDEYCRAVSNIIRNRAGADSISISTAPQLLDPDITWSRLHYQSQQNLVSFLAIELDLANTLCGIAENDTGPERRLKLRRKIEHAIHTVRQFAGQVEDRTKRKSILNRVKELEDRRRR
jgi:DNA-binding response OmpR family regulator